MMSMNTEERKQVLLEHKAIIEEELGKIAVPSSENPGGYAAHEPNLGHEHASDENDLADEQEEFGNNHAITNDLEQRLLDVNDALEKIENGTYGICEKSGKPIEEDRLDALPSARTCKEFM